MQASFFLKISIIALSTSSLAEDGKSTPRLLSLEDAVQLALKNNLQLEIENIDVNIQEESIEEAKGEFDPELNLRSIYESIENPQNQQEFVATGLARYPGRSRLFVEENVRLESSIDGKLPLGTKWSLVAESNRLKNTLNSQRDSLFFPEYDTFFGIRLTQPLLRDFGTKIQLTNVHLATSDRQLADIDWHRQLRETVADVAKSYYDLIFAGRDETIKENSIALAAELLVGNKKRLEEGVASIIEVSQAEVAVSVREEALISARHFYRENQNLLIRQLYREFDISNPPQLRPSGGLDTVPPKIDKVELVASALENRLEYQANIAQMGKQDIEIQYLKNQLLPRVDLVGTLGGNGLGGDFASGFEDAASQDRVQWSAGVVVSIPLGTRTEKARIQSKNLQKRQLVLNLKQIELDIAIQIDTAFSRYETTRQRLVTARRSAELSRQTLDEEQKRLTQGVTNSFQILAAQEDVATAKTRELAAQVDLQKSLIDLWLASGILLNKLNITVDRPDLYSDDKRVHQSK